MAPDRSLQLARAYTTYGDVLYGEGLYAEAADWYRRAEAVRQGAVRARDRVVGPSTSTRVSPTRAARPS